MSNKTIDFVKRQIEIVQGENVIGESKLYWGVFVGVVGVILMYPLFSSQFAVLQMTVYFTWIFLALSLAIVWGYTGIFSFGQVAFFGLGGYVYGIVAFNIIDITGATNIALLSGVVAPAILAAIFGYFMFYGRVSGVYVAIITLSVTLILELIFSSATGVSIGSADLGGYNGLNLIPELTLGISGISYEFEIVSLYYFIVLSLLCLYIGLRYLVNTKFGYAMLAIREDQDRAEMLGYDIRYIKLIVFSFAGAIAGFGGAMFAAWGNYIDPTSLGLIAAALPIIWVTVGGRETLIGPIIAAFVLQYVDNSISSYNASAATILIGVVLIAIILLAPSGIVPKVASIVKNRKIVRDNGE